MPLQVIGTIFVISFIAAASAFIYKLASRPADSFARGIRWSAVGFGFLMYFASAAFDEPIASILLKSLGIGGGAAYKVVSALAPGLIGSLVTLLLFRVIGEMKEENHVFINLIIVMMTFLLFACADTFFESFLGDKDNEGLLSNISFIAGVMSVILFSKNGPGSLKAVLNDEGEVAKKPSKKKVVDWRSDL